MLQRLIERIFHKPEQTSKFNPQDLLNYTESNFNFLEDTLNHQTNYVFVEIISKYINNLKECLFPPRKRLCMLLKVTNQNVFDKLTNEEIQRFYGELNNYKIELRNKKYESKKKDGKISSNKLKDDWCIEYEERIFYESIEYDGTNETDIFYYEFHKQLINSINYKYNLSRNKQPTPVIIQIKDLISHLNLDIFTAIDKDTSIFYINKPIELSKYYLLTNPMINCMTSENKLEEGRIPLEMQYFYFSYLKQLPIKRIKKEKNLILKKEDILYEEKAIEKCNLVVELVRYYKRRKINVEEVLQGKDLFRDRFIGSREDFNQENKFENEVEDRILNLESKNENVIKSEEETITQQDENVIQELISHHEETAHKEIINQNEKGTKPEMIIQDEIITHTEIIHQNENVIHQEENVIQQEEKETKNENVFSFFNAQSNEIKPINLFENKDINLFNNSGLNLLENIGANNNQNVSKELFSSNINLFQSAKNDNSFNILESNSFNFLGNIQPINLFSTASTNESRNEPINLFNKDLQSGSANEEEKFELPKRTLDFNKRDNS